MKARLKHTAEQAGERLLLTPHNPISMGITLTPSAAVATVNINNNFPSVAAAVSRSSNTLYATAAAINSNSTPSSAATALNSSSSNNNASDAVSISSSPAPSSSTAIPSHTSVTLLGSMLFARCCSGARIVDIASGKKQVRLISS